MIGPQAIWIVLVLTFLLFGAKKPAEPHVGFSRAMRPMRRRISASSRGRPTRLVVDRQHQKSWKPWRCQARTAG